MVSLQTGFPVRLLHVRQRCPGTFRYARAFRLCTYERRISHKRRAGSPASAYVETCIAEASA
jgi:hypothetical protein